MHAKKKKEITTCIKSERLSILFYTYRKINVSYVLTYSQTVFTL